jgi:hypothetical protein
LKSQIEECDFILHIYSSRPFQRLVNSFGPNLVPNIWDTMGFELLKGCKYNKKKN